MIACNAYSSCKLYRLRLTVLMGRNGAGDTTSSPNLGEEYQQGPRLKFWNVREYVLARDGHMCQWCQGKSKDRMLHMHLTYGYLMKYVRRNNRQLHKATIRKGGKRQRNTARKYVHGFRLFDCVRYENVTCFVFGRRSSGYFDLRTLDGTKICASASYKKLNVVQKASAFLVERRAAFPSVP